VPVLPVVSFTVYVKVSAPWIYRRIVEKLPSALIVTLLQAAQFALETDCAVAVQSGVVPVSGSISFTTIPPQLGLDATLPTTL